VHLISYYRIFIQLVEPCNVSAAFGVENDTSKMAVGSADSSKVLLWSTKRPELFFGSQEIKQLVLLSLAFSLVFLFPMLFDGRVTGPGLGAWLITPQLRHFASLPTDGTDRDVFMELRWVPYYTIMHFHQLPYWNPYKCGGMHMLGNPESGIFTPFLLFYLAFGMVPGLLLEVFLHVALMFAGGYVLGRELRLVPLAALVLAAMFPSSSWLSLHAAVGHLNFLSTAYIPWIIALLLSSCRLHRWHLALLGGLLCGLTLTEGNYGFVFAAMLVAVTAVWEASIRLSIRPLVVAALIGTFSLALSLPKLVPTSEQLAINPRDWGMSFLTGRGILISLFSRDQDLSHPMVASFFFTEYACYLSPPLLLLAVIGALGQVRKSVPWILGGIFFFLAYRGDTGPNAVTMLLRHLPLGGNIGLCGRWVIPLFFCISVLAALGAQSLCDRPQEWARRLAGILLTLGIADSWLVCAPSYRYLFQPPLVAPDRSEEFRQYWSPFPVPLTSIGEAGMGSTNCGGVGYTVPRGNVLGYNEKGYRGDYYLLGPGDVTETEWTPNRLTYQIDIPKPTSLVINQTMYPGWRLARGTGLAYADKGLIAVWLPPGRQEIELRFTPHYIRAAFAIAFFALATLIIVWCIERRFR